MKTMISNILEHAWLIRQVYFNENDILVTRHDIFSMTFVNFEITLKWHYDDHNTLMNKNCVEMRGIYG